MMADRLNIFVLGLDPFEHRMLETIEDAAHYTFHACLDASALDCTAPCDGPELLAQARARLDTAAESVDGVTGWGEFPATVLIPLLRHERDLPGPGLEAVLRWEHRAWARRLQAEVLPEATPRFAVLDPQAPPPLADLGLTPPFVLRPVAGRAAAPDVVVETADQYEPAVAAIRAVLGPIARPFSYFLERATVPEEVGRIAGWACVAEDMAEGTLLTLEGSVHGGAVQVHGILEGAGTAAGEGVRYPAALPPAVGERLETLARTWVAHTALDETPFTITVLWDRGSDRLVIRDTAVRQMAAYAPLFLLVDGASHQQAAVRLSHGAAPDLPERAGGHAHAALLTVRSTEDAVVTHAPTADEVAQLEASFGCRIQIMVEAGQRLSEVLEEGAGGYELARAYVGGADRDAVAEAGARLRERLPLTLEPVARRPASC